MEKFALKSEKHLALNTVKYLQAVYLRRRKTFVAWKDKRNY